MRKYAIKEAANACIDRLAGFSTRYNCTADRNRVHNILGVEDPLKLDDEEVDELLHIFKRSFKRFPRDGEVSAGTHRLCNAGSEGQFRRRFDQCNSPKGDPKALQQPADGWHVAKSEDGCEGRRERNAGDARVLPLLKLVSFCMYGNT